MSHERELFVESLRHAHDHGAGVAVHETKTRWVVVLTFLMMVAELVVGYATGSLALTADGWHMATHAGALGMAAFAYWFARKEAGSSTFSFGTGKVHALAGYTSAVVLALIALLMIVESVRRLVHPEPIAFGEALPVAVIGLLVNLASVKLLQTDEHHHHHGHDHHHEDDHHHEHDHHHDHEHDGHHEHHEGHHDHHHHAEHRPDRAQGSAAAHDHNLRAAYFHVLADALTSVLAILALLGGRYFGWNFLDALMGIVGGVVISRWSWGLCRGAAKQLLDVVPSPELLDQIRTRLEAELPGTHVVDLHLWEIGPGARALIVSVASETSRTANEIRAALAKVAPLEHVTVEVHVLPGA